MKVNVLDEDTLVMNLEFTVQETTCLRESGDPSTCAFQRGYSVVSDPERNAREGGPHYVHDHEQVRSHQRSLAIACLPFRHTLTHYSISWHGLCALGLRE